MARRATPPAARVRKYPVGRGTGPGEPPVTPSVLERAARRVADRLAALEARLDSGSYAVWREYLQSLHVLATVVPLLGPGQTRLLSSAELAARLGVAPKTVRKWKARGLIRPAVERGRVVRWKADQGIR